MTLFAPSRTSPIPQDASPISKQSTRAGSLWAFVFVAPTLFSSVQLGRSLEPTVLPLSQISTSLLLLGGGWRLMRTGLSIRSLLIFLLAFILTLPSITSALFSAPELRFQDRIVALSICASTIAYSQFFLSIEDLIVTIRRCTVAALGIASFAYLAALTNGSAWLVHLQYGSPRLQGTLSEPSAWAPFAAFLILDGWRLKSNRLIISGLAAATLTFSPIVILTAVLSVLGTLAVSARSRSKRIRNSLAAALMCVGSISVFAIVDFPSSRDGTYVERSLGRIDSGIDSILSGGTEGENDRYSSTLVVFTEVSDQDAKWLGFGPGGSDRIFTAGAERLGGAQPNSLPVLLFADYGLLGLVLFVWWLGSLFRRLPKQQTLSLFLPFIFASLVNSASGYQLYKFVLLVGLASVASGYHKRSSATAESHGVVALGL